MSDWSQALAEAYVAAPDDQIILATLELMHSTFEVGPVRLVASYGDLLEEPVPGAQEDAMGHMMTLEADAPYNPGEEVVFLSCMFDVTLPEQSESRTSGLSIRIDNAARILSPQLDLVVTTRDPLTLIYREYLASDVGAPQYIIKNLSFTSIKSNVTHVLGLAEFGDLVNRKFPNKVYRPEEYRSLLS